MSYILDALRRADAERARSRGAAPGLHANERVMVEMGDDEDARPPARIQPLRLLVAVVGLMGLVAAGWWWMRPVPNERGTVLAAGAAERAPVVREVMPPAAPTAAPVAAPVAATSNPPPAAQPITPSPAPAQTPVTAAVQTPQPQPQAQAPAPAPARAARPAPAAAKPPASRPVKKPAEEPLSPPAGAETPRVSALPDALRRELPPMVVSGSMYAPEASGRMLVLDGQVMREGQALRPGLVVEHIGPSAATLSYKGQRFALPYR